VTAVLSYADTSRTASILFRVQANYTNTMRAVSLLCSIAVAGATYEGDDNALHLVQLGVSKMGKFADEPKTEHNKPGTCSITDDTIFSVFDSKMKISALELGADIDTDTDTTFKLKDFIQHDNESKDMWLVRGRAHDESTVRIEARYFRNKASEHHQVFVKSLAIGGGFINNHTLVIRPLQDDCSWNDLPILVDESSSFSVNGLLEASRNSTTIEFQLPKGIRFAVTRSQKYVNVAITMAPLVKQDGLCGNFNGDPADDTMGMILSRGPRVEQLHTLFPEAWSPSQQFLTEEHTDSVASAMDLDLGVAPKMDLDEVTGEAEMQDPEPEEEPAREPR